ncbi:hypothetical protein AAHE18_20G172300 [Arachis hypogaea]
MESIFTRLQISNNNKDARQRQESKNQNQLSCAQEKNHHNCCRTTNHPNHSLNTLFSAYKSTHSNCTEVSPQFSKQEKNTKGISEKFIFQKQLPTPECHCDLRSPKIEISQKWDSRTTQKQVRKK